MLRPSSRLTSSLPLAATSSTLYPDSSTTARRGRPIPQLTCKGPACRKYARFVYVVQCQNAGDDGTGNVQWQVRCLTR
jgi:hypothetical protein